MNLNETNFLISVCLAISVFIFVLQISLYSKLKDRQGKIDEIINGRLKAFDNALQELKTIKWKVDIIYDSIHNNQKIPGDHFMNIDLD